MARFVNFLFFLCILLNTSEVVAKILVGAADSIIPVNVGADLIGDSDDNIAKYRLNDDYQHATAFVFASQSESLAIVSVDTLYITSLELSDVKYILRQNGFRGKVILVATHGHANLVRESGGGRSRIISAIVDAVLKADASKQPSEISGGYGYFLGSLNRVQRDPDGASSHTHQHHMQGQPLEVWIHGHPNNNLMVDHKADPIDPIVGVLHIRNSATQKTIGTLVNYASHPVIIHSRKGGHGISSADYPGYLKRIVQEKLGGKVGFLQGAAGDMVPANAGLSDPTLAHVELSRFSNGLAAAVISTVFNLDHYDVPEELHFSERSVEFGLPTPIGNCAGQPTSLPVSAARVGENFYIGSMAGEPFVDLGIRVKNGLQDMGALVFFTGYTNEAIAYIPPQDDFGTGGYGTTPNKWMCVDETTGERSVGAILEMMDALSLR